MFVTISRCDQLACFADCVGMILLAFSLLLPLPTCFLRVCVLKLFAAVLNFFLQLITSAISGAATSNISAPTHFAALTIYLRKNGIAVLPVTSANTPNRRPRYRQTPR